MVKSKQAFWQALIFTIVIFAAGIWLGFMLENSRIDDVRSTLSNAESSLLDEQLRNRVVQNFEIACDIAVESTFNFADKIYAEATLLEKYDTSSKFRDDLTLIHRRYDLLRMMLWEEAIQLKKRCPGTFHTVIYFFDYQTQDLVVRAEQTAVSRTLIELKETYGNEILLIPIAADLNLSSIELVRKKYKITKSPAVVIDESEVIRRIAKIQELQTAIFKSNKE